MFNCFTLLFLTFPKPKAGAGLSSCQLIRVLSLSSWHASLLLLLKVGVLVSVLVVVLLQASLLPQIQVLSKTVWQFILILGHSSNPVGSNCLEPLGLNFILWQWN